jgi:predicted membrane protein
MRKLFLSVVLTALAVALSIVSVSAGPIGPTP